MDVRASQGDTLDLLCFRYYGRTASVVEAALNANPGLADLGAVLPAGTLLTLPDAAKTMQASIEQVQLWN